MLRRVVSHHRTALAASLVAIAVLVPTTAWYVSGSREASRRAASQREAAVREVLQRTVNDATRLEDRLSALVSAEAGRPFYHYQSVYHDPRGASQGLAVTRSPLAAGLSDPLVLAHFQIDASGALSLPTVNERFPELSSDEDLAEFCEVLGELQNGVVLSELERTVVPYEGERVLILDRAAWNQIRQAESVYGALTGRSGQTAPPGVLAYGTPEPVVIRVGPLRWQTVVLGSGPVLAALREVVTPDGTLVQGFAVATTAVTTWLGPGLSFVPAPPGTDTVVSAPVANTEWYLVADAGEAVLAAETRARQITAQFRRTFGVSSAAALSAALAVIVIVIQTDRTARQRARFAAAAAHELKTPLTTVRLHSEMLGEGLGDPSKVRSYAQRIAPEVQRLGRVVANMLDLSRLERGAALARPEAGELGAAVAECVDRIRPTLQAAGLVVDLQIGEPLPPALFDHDALCQILDNLLDNADKHTRGVPDRSISVAVTREGPWLKITLADNGPGIPRRLRRQLFQPFARHTEGPSGLGLGLAVARSLARAQGGDLRLVESQPGAVFEVSLPAAPPSAQLT